ncbi:hypothetical protein DFP72DRAFT_833755, partial [Ephemerocybe angulata]
YLISVSDDERWLSLLQSFHSFEAQSPVNKRMGTAGRPPQVQAWIKGRNKVAPPALELDTYGPAVQGWWKMIQPGWRITELDDPSAPLSRDVPADADWGMLCYGGSAGMYTLVMAASWWVGKAGGGSPWSTDLASFVEDVAWVLEAVSHARSQQAVASGSVAKRGRAIEDVDGSDEDEPKILKTVKTKSGREVKK